MALAAEILRSSFERAVEKAPDLTHRFYEILFQRYPLTRAMFGRHSAAKQEKMLADAIAAVLDHLEDAPWLTGTLTGLGAKHAGYGVSDHMYGWVGECLLATFAQVLGDEWTPQTQDAWVAAYGAIVGLMQQGAQQARAAA